MRQFLKVSKVKVRCRQSLVSTFPYGWDKLSANAPQDCQDSKVRPLISNAWRQWHPLRGFRRAPGLGSAHLNAYSLGIRV